VTANSPPLDGRRILVTRAAHQIGTLSEKLREAGAIPVEVPVLEIQPPESFADLDAALRRFSNYDWLILTSANTVHALSDRANQLGLSLDQRDSLKVAAIGEGTAKAATEAGLKVTIVPVSNVSESLVSALEGRISGARVLLARAAVARDLIPDALRQSGAQVDVVDAYRNGIPAEASDQLRRALAEGLDAATFTSSSSVNHLKAAAMAAGLAWPFHGVAAISIGAITSETLREQGWEPAAEASVSDIPGLVKTVAEYFVAS
jgi:uroporphyrinogen-III synthase/uroporphyrinogen III methyltransferase/synthase